MIFLRRRRASEELRPFLWSVVPDTYSSTWYLVPWYEVFIVIKHLAHALGFMSWPCQVHVMSCHVMCVRSSLFVSAYGILLFRSRTKHGQTFWSRFSLRLNRYRVRKHVLVVAVLVETGRTRYSLQSCTSTHDNFAVKEGNNGPPSQACCPCVRTAHVAVSNGEPMWQPTHTIL